MKKIGIATLYYNNRNYGANLQTFALCKMIEQLGCDVEVISYRNCTKAHRLFSDIKQSFIRRSGRCPQIEDRNRAIDRFNNTIPHSQLYYINTIYRANMQYDCFVTGSDQVWNPGWINQYLSLEFVDPSKRRVAYAASTGKISLNSEQRLKIKRAIEATDIISLREKESIPSLQELTEKKIEYVLDPTMLLTADDWNDICSARIIREGYLFCYFLCDNENLRKVADAYAKQRNLKIVTLPYLNGAYRKADDSFGDYQLFKVSPEDFLSLIRHASFVMTDSFHAAVFSHIYEREFVVSSSINNEMGCRMVSLTELFGTGNRYIKDHDLITLEILTNLEQLPLQFNRVAYESMRKKSLDYLERALKE